MLPDGKLKTLVSDAFAQINQAQWRCSELYVEGFREHGRERQLQALAEVLTQAEDAVCALRAEAERLVPAARDRDLADREAMTAEMPTAKLRAVS